MTDCYISFGKVLKIVFIFQFTTTSESQKNVKTFLRTGKRGGEGERYEESLPSTVKTDYTIVLVVLVNELFVNDYSQSLSPYPYLFMWGFPQLLMAFISR